MQNQHLTWNTEPADEIKVRPSLKASPCLQLACARTRHRKLRIALPLPLPRREPCLTRRAMLAALREAEFHAWLASGGDFLTSMHQPVL